MLRTIWNRALSFLQDGARATRAALGIPDLARWRRVGSEIPSWDERNARIGAMIPASSAVVDIGCGAQTLRRHLPAGCRYQPVDVIQHDPGVWVWDFNEGPFPRQDARFDVVVCSGVFEYARAPERFLREVAALAPRVILSFSSRDDVPSTLQRRAAGWTNDLSAGELEKLVASVGLRSHKAGSWERQTIYELTRIRP